MLKTEWGDAQVWMKVAEDLYLRHAKDPNDFLRARGGFPSTSEMNVAVVCAGFAFELILKVIVRAAGGAPDPTHPPRDAYNKLAEQSPHRLIRILAKEPTMTTAEYIPAVRHRPLHCTGASCRPRGASHSTRRYPPENAARQSPSVNPQHAQHESLSR